MEERTQRVRAAGTAQVHKQENAQLKHALSASKMGTWRLNLTDQSVVWDDRVLAILGLTRRDLPSSLTGYVKHIHARDKRKTYSVIQNAIKKLQDFHVEHRMISKSKGTIWVEVWGKVLHREHSAPSCLVGCIQEVTQRKQTEENLSQRDQLFYALSQATSELLTNSNLDQAMQKGISQIGAAMGVDRVYMFQNDFADPEVPRTSQRFEWNSGNADPQFNNPSLQKLPLAAYEPCSTMLATGQHFSAIVSEMPDQELKSLLQTQEILSVLLVPVMVKGQFWGFIGFDDCTREVEWSNVQLSVLRSYTSTLSNALENRMAEKEKAEWRVRYELIASASGQVIYDYDIQTGSILWGGNIEAVLGYSREEMGDINQWAELIHPEDRARSLDSLTYSEAHVLPYDQVYRFLTKSGQYIVMQDKGFFTSDQQGKAQRMLGSMRDISDLHKAAQELKESEERYRTLLEASFSGLGIHDNGIMIDVNHGLADLSGYSREELIGMNTLQLVAPDYRDLVMERIAARDEDPYDIEAIHKDGSRRHLEVHGKSITYKGKVMRVTEFRDITDRKLTAEKMQEQNERLTAIAESLTKKNEQLEEFTQIVSHNLRSPAGNLNSLLTLLSQTQNEKDKADLISLLHQSGDSIMTTLSELNEVLQVKQDLQIAREQIRFEDALLKAKQMVIARINEAQATLQYDFQVPELVYPRIYLDSIILNLLSNALKYKHPKRPPAIHFKTYLIGKQVILEVSDNGLGINLAKHGHQIFKLRKTFHYHPESRGVGLFMIKNQIEAMGGEIGLVSEENKGTTFIVNFNKVD